MLVNINSTVSFNRKEDLKCVRQARNDLNNIYKRFVKNAMAKPDKDNKILVLGSLNTEASYNKHVDDKVYNMTRQEVIAFLKNAEITFKAGLKEIYEGLLQSKSKLNSVQKNLMTKMQGYFESETLISMPKNHK